MKLALPAFPRLGKPAIVLGFALVIGVMAAFAANRFLAGRIEAIEARNRGETVDVVVARHAMVKGQVVDAGSVAVRAVPKAWAQSNALGRQEFGKVSGRALAYDLGAGEMLLASLLEVPRPSTFSARLEPGRRAMTVAVDEINSISGLLDPGDTIDLIVGVERKGKKLTVPLLQAVQVMATGQRVVDDPQTGERRQYATVTLNLTPSQASALIGARDGGRITALLRQPQDRQGASGDTVDLAALLGEAGGETAEIPVLYASTIDKLPADALWLDGAPRDGAALAARAVNAVVLDAARSTTANRAGNAAAVPAPRSGAAQARVATIPGAGQPANAP
jgi:pilus assembly protein CpaB